MPFRPEENRSPTHSRFGVPKPFAAAAKYVALAEFARHESFRTVTCGCFMVFRRSGVGLRVGETKDEEINSTVGVLRRWSRMFDM